MRILGVFKEEFGEVWIYTKKLGIEFISLGSLQIGIKETNSSRLIDLDLKYTEINNSYPEFSFLLPVMLYQCENGIGTELKWAGSYKQLSKLVIKNQWMPIAIFCQLKKKDLENLTKAKSEKALLIRANDKVDLEGYRDIVVAEDIDSIDLSLNNQDLLWLCKGNGKIVGTNKSRILFLGECEGVFSSYEIYLGSKSRLSGSIEAERLSISKGAVVEGQVAFKN